MRQVRAQSRALLDDLRRLVGLLRDADHVDAVETVEAIERLVADARASGRDVSLRVEGRTDGVGSLGQLVAFRMVQESLANAALHAPGAACAVAIDGSRPDLVVVTVRNDAPAAASGTAREGLGLLERQGAGEPGADGDGAPRARRLRDPGIARPGHDARRRGKTGAERRARPQAFSSKGVIAAGRA